ncbi:uncharacterized protein LOC135226699 [Macrobrachium nipponense]|uniref:uncharacterized protein LOC135226699 n=1 Tax=Macrobrachium nipponense TaxID=159736 RepID=UPI0030C8668E
MHSSKLFLFSVALAWIASVDATFAIAGASTGLILGGLAALKGAALLGYAIGKKKKYAAKAKPFIFKRSVGEVLVNDQEETELFSAVEKLDPAGCIPKLLCHLQFKEEALRTPEENVLVQMFSNRPDDQGSYGSAFAYAAEVGQKGADSTVCEEHFNTCPYSKDNVSEMLQESWGCALRPTLMHHNKLTLAAMTLLWAATANATIIITGVTTGLVLGAEAEEHLLSTVGKLDPSGCVLKLLCHLQFKEESSRTPEEEVLVQMFGNGTEALSSHSAAFVFASEIGSRNRDPAVCERYFSQCPFRGEEVSGLLQESWACGGLRDLPKER